MKPGFGSAGQKRNEIEQNNSLFLLRVPKISRTNRILKYQQKNRKTESKEELMNEAYF